jgi:2-polyprenyl-3-methyl-5-hydroxy-6-metoxy-1,4-benzoquinol methylase
MLHYSHCPVCKAPAIQPAFSAKDFTVTKEQFAVWKCSQCTAMFTQDIPSQEQIGKYYKSENYISHSDTQKGFINKLYHRIRKRTLNKKMNLVKSETGLETGNILDIGCGTGAFLNTMQQAGWKVTGLEPDEDARATALSLYKIQPLVSQVIFALPAAHFDAVTAWHVMEHVHQLHEYVDQLKKIITPKGKIFIAVPNYTSPDATHYKSHWAAYDVPRHLYHFSPNSMSVLMEMHGMKVEKIMPMWFDSFYVSMLSEQYKNGRGNIVKAFFVGLMSNV